MIRFELKKIFAKGSGKIALLVLLGILVLECFFATDVEWLDSEGIHHTGIKAARNLRAACKEWSGVLDEEMIRSVIRENNRIEAMPGSHGESGWLTNEFYAKKQGFDEIRGLLYRNYASGLYDYDYLLADRLSEDVAPDFYDNRVKLLRNYLYEEGSGGFTLYSEAEKQFLIRQYENIETPFQVDYFKGWDQLIYVSPGLIMMSVLVICYLASGIFANEFRWKADAVFFSTDYGRTKANAAKIKAGIVMVTMLYWISVACYTLYVLCYLGFDGMNVPIQFSMWNSFYNLSHGQVYALTVLLGYLGALFFAMLTMWVSAKTKSAVFAVTLPFIFIMLPSFLGDIKSLDKILCLLPDKLLSMGQDIRYFYLCSFGSKVYGAYQVLPWFYSLLALCLIPVLYLEYRRKQIT